MTAPTVDVQAEAARRAAALTRRLDKQTAREADDRASRLAAGIPDWAPR